MFTAECLAMVFWFSLHFPAGFEKGIGRHDSPNRFACVVLCPRKNLIDWDTGAAASCAIWSESGKPGYLAR